MFNLNEGRIEGGKWKVEERKEKEKVSWTGVGRERLEEKRSVRREEV